MKPLAGGSVENPDPRQVFPGNCTESIGHLHNKYYHIGRIKRLHRSEILLEDCDPRAANTRKVDSVRGILIFFRRILTSGPAPIFGTRQPFRYESKEWRRVRPRLMTMCCARPMELPAKVLCSGAHPADDPANNAVRGERCPPATRPADKAGLLFDPGPPALPPAAERHSPPHQIFL